MTEAKKYLIFDKADYHTIRAIASIIGLELQEDPDISLAQELFKKGIYPPGTERRD